MAKSTKKILSNVQIRMYKMGTGDCFALKFNYSNGKLFKMLIDCGTWSGSEDSLEPYMANLFDYLNYEVDVLVVTHEHKDHVHVFDACSELFENGITDSEGNVKKLQIKKVWMGWTENDGNSKVKTWKKDYGDKKKALMMAIATLQDSQQKNSDAYNDERYKRQINESKATFIDAASSLAGFYLGANKTAKEYIGGMEGMDLVKNILGKNITNFYKQGTIIEEVEGAEGLKFYVLGPPSNFEKDVNVESGGEGETYDHNKVLIEAEAFAAAVIHEEDDNDLTIGQVVPFEDMYIDVATEEGCKPIYFDDKNKWRRIDTEWLNSAGMLALRMNSLTNNLSLALAIKLPDDDKVLLFPGDAEYGSWRSWHNIKWDEKAKDETKHLTEELLNNTVFYKVAHHMSHNGTARRLGLDMMTNKNLTAMATLDYNTIAPAWKNTMPNAMIAKELIRKTGGRLMIMNEDGLKIVDTKELVSTKIKEAQAKMSVTERNKFKKNFVNEEYFMEYTLNL